MPYLGDYDVPSLHAALKLLLAANPPRAEGAVHPVLHVARVWEHEASLLSHAPVHAPIGKTRGSSVFYVLCMLMRICMLVLEVVKV